MKNSKIIKVIILLLAFLLVFFSINALFYFKSDKRWHIEDGITFKCSKDYELKIDKSDEGLSAIAIFTKNAGNMVIYYQNTDEFVTTDEKNNRCLFLLDVIMDQVKSQYPAHTSSAFTPYGKVEIPCQGAVFGEKRSLTKKSDLIKYECPFETDLSKGKCMTIVGKGKEILIYFVSMEDDYAELNKLLYSLIIF